MNERQTREQLLVLVRNVLADVLDDESLQLTESSTAEDVEDWDSINQVKLLIGLENELNLRFRSNEVEGLKDVGSLLDLLEKKLQP